MSSLASNAAESAERASHAARDFFQRVVQRGEEVAKSSVERTTDLLYTTEARWKDLSLQEVVHKGTRKALAVVGVLHETKAPASLRQRERSFVVTRRLLEHIDKEFDAMTRDTEALAMRFETLCNLLNQFRMACDATTTTSASSTPSAASEHIGDSAALDVDEDQKGIELFRQQMRGLLTELKETVSVNCGGLTKSAMRDMDTSYTAAIKSTELSATNLDLSERAVVVATDDLKKAKEEHARFNQDDPRIAPIVVRVGQRESKLMHCEAEVAEHREKYQEAIRHAHCAMVYAQEQTSMSTWSAYQVLFSQMTHFFSDAATQSANISKVLVNLKNKQQVSLKITAEKKLRSEEVSAAAKQTAMDRVLFGTPTVQVPMSSPPPPPSLPQEAVSEANVTDDFDFLVQSRVGSSGREGSLPAETAPAVEIAQALPPPVATAASPTTESGARGRAGGVATAPQWEDIFC